MDAFGKFFSLDNDIKFRGGISYRGLRFIGLIAMTLSQFGLLFYFLSKAANYMIIDGLTFVFPEWLHQLCTTLGHITFPCLLIASFATVVSKTDEIIKVLLTNLALALLTYVFCAFFLPGIIESFITELPSTILDTVNLPKIMSIIAKNPSILEALGIPASGVDWSSIISKIDWAEISPVIKEIMPAISSQLAKLVIVNFVNINVFWDLFLCSLFYFFISYKPKKLQGGKLMLFRCCAVLPAFYIVICSFLDGLLKANLVDMPTWGLAMLTNRRLPSYILFFLIVLLFKFIEVEHLHRGGTRESYIEILMTRKSALAFSVFTAISLAIICLVDYLLKGFTNYASWGVGSTYYSAAAIPFILLFTFNKKPKKKWPDIFIPIYYVINYTVLMVLVFLILMSLPYLLETIA